MTLLVKCLGDGGRSLNACAEPKEAGYDIVTRQDVEQRRGIFRVRPVIKGQGYDASLSITGPQTLGKKGLEHSVQDWIERRKLHRHRDIVAGLLF